MSGIPTLYVPQKRHQCPVRPVRRLYGDVWLCRTRFGYVKRHVVKKRLRKRIPKSRCLRTRRKSRLHARSTRCRFRFRPRRG